MKNKVENLFEQCAEILVRLAMDGNMFHQASDDEKQAIISNIQGSIQAYEHRDFKGFIDNMLSLHNIQSDIYPEEFHPAHVDFFIDKNMWDWVISSSTKEPTDYDWDAAGYIVRELQERLNKNEIFLSE